MHRSPLRVLEVPLAVAGATLVAAVLAALLMRAAPETKRALRTRPHDAAPAVAAAAAARPFGVRAALAGSDAERGLPTLAFALEPGASLDPAVPAADLGAELVARFNPGKVRRAQLGAQVQGGRVLVRVDDVVVHSDAARDEPREGLATLPIDLPPGTAEIAVEFRRTGDAPAALRVLWQADGALVPAPVPAHGAPLGGSAAVRGEALAIDLGCARCHAADDPGRQRRLAGGTAPRLERAAARLVPGWTAGWIAAPTAYDPHARMPALGIDAGTATDIEHFLASVAARDDGARPGARPSAALRDAGLVAYHQVGCVACHGPREAPERVPGVDARAPAVARVPAPLPDLARKWRPAALAAFLADPLATHPDGAMPSLALSAGEAEAIAAYLLDGGETVAASPIAPEPARVERGRAAFTAQRCSACHQGLVDEVPPAPSLTAVAAAPDRGCLAEAPSAGAPRFAIDDAQRSDLRAFLARAAAPAATAPLDELAADMLRLRCTTCHAFHAERGAEPGVQAFMTSLGEADLGDEGRMPPDLTDAGARLTVRWMREVLVEDQRARPYLATRMPVFGAANVDHLPERFAAAAGATALLEREPDFTREAAAHGRTLVGVRGLNCIQCHSVGGRPSTGTPGPDLALMPGRLSYDFFRRWLADPGAVRPGTRMPTFFVNGRSGVTDVLGGWAEPQIAAIWAYLSQGEMLAPPEGIVDPAGLELVVGAEPIVFRTFMADAGVRAVACGFPEGLHGAFDAERCELALAWTGAFLNASGAWANRGGSETNPQAVRWTAPAVRGGPPLLDLPGEADAAPASRRFRGYRLDERRRPVFIHDLARGAVVVRIEESLTPEGALLVRTLTFAGPPGATVLVRPGDARTAGTSPGASADVQTLRLDDQGRATLRVEVTP